MHMLPCLLPLPALTPAGGGAAAKTGLHPAARWCRCRHGPLQRGGQRVQARCMEGWWVLRPAAPLGCSCPSHRVLSRRCSTRNAHGYRSGTKAVEPQSRKCREPHRSGAAPPPWRSPCPQTRAPPPAAGPSARRTSYPTKAAAGAGEGSTRGVEWQAAERAAAERRQRRRVGREPAALGRSVRHLRTSKGRGTAAAASSAAILLELITRFASLLPPSPCSNSRRAGHLAIGSQAAERVQSPPSAWSGSSADERG